MAGINKVILVGHLGKDPEIRYTQSGAAVASLTVATSRSWTNKSTNEREEETEWHRIVAWGKLAEFCEKYLSKGRQVYVEGRIQTRSYEKDGIKRYSTEIVADTVQALGPRDGASGDRQGGQAGGGRQRQGNGGRGQAQERRQSQPQQSQQPQDTGYDNYIPEPADDIPF